MLAARALGRERERERLPAGIGRPRTRGWAARAREIRSRGRLYGGGGGCGAVGEVDARGGISRREESTVTGEGVAARWASRGSDEHVFVALRVI